MGRPKKDPDDRIDIGMYFRLDKETAEQLNQLSERYCLNKSEIIRKLIKSKYMNMSKTFKK